MGMNNHKVVAQVWSSGSWVTVATVESTDQPNWWCLTLGLWYPKAERILAFAL